MRKASLLTTLVITIGLSIIYAIQFFKPQTSLSNINISYLVNLSDPPNDKFTNCLLDAHKIFTNLSLPWFLAFGTALMYYRSNSFISDDIDIGIFIDDLQIRNITDGIFVLTAQKHGFKLFSRYGNMTHGQGWTLTCPRSKLHFGIFVFYHGDIVKNETFAWWTASYNGPCNNMRYRKCRWWFSEFEPTTFEMYDRYFQIVPTQFLIEQYGTNWIFPKRYGYFESIEFLPNLINEH